MTQPTLIIERHDGATWLCALPHPGSSSVILLAKFVNDEARAIYNSAHAHALLAARAVGAGGLA